MPRKPLITAIEPGTYHPSTTHPPKGLAQIAVEDDWVAALVGVPLVVRDEHDGLGPGIVVGSLLPSGTAIQFQRHHLGGPLYSLYVDGDAVLHEALNEFLLVTGLDPNAVRWRSPEA